MTRPFSAPFSTQRRRFLLSGLTLASALPMILSIETFSRSARADEYPDVDPKDPVAKAQGYVKNVDKVKPPIAARKKDAYCWNCVLYNANFLPAGSTPDKSQRGSCAVLGMKRVGYGDYCNSWVQNGAMTGKKHS